MDTSFTFFQSVIKEQFIGSFASSFDRVQEWTSMQSLIVVSAIDEHFDVLMTHEELKAITTLESLHKLVILKMED